MAWATKCAVAILLCVPGFRQAALGRQCDPTLVLELIRGRGHQDVRIEQAAEGLVASYSDRVSRQPLWEGIAIQRRLEHAGCAPAVIRASRYGLPLPVVAGSSPALSRPASETMDFGGPRVDLDVELVFRYRVSYWYDPVRTHIAVAPRLRIWWPSGVSVNAQYAFPLQNQWGEPSYRYFDTPYPNLATVGLRRRIASRLLLSMSFGLFTRNRYGADVQAYWLVPSLPVVAGVRTSVTGYWSWWRGSWGSSRAETFLPELDVTAYLPFYGLRIRGRAGVYLAPDPVLWRPGEYLVTEAGLKGELARMFGEVEVGFSAFLQGGVVYPAIRLSVPMLPRRGLARGRFALRGGSRVELPWDLGRVVRGSATGYLNQDRGETFSTGNDLWPDLRYLSERMLRALAR